MANVYNSQLDAFDLYHLYNESHQERSSLQGPALPALGHAIAGSIGSVTSNAVVYPLSLVITRLQVQRVLRNESSATEVYDSLGNALKEIIRREGVRRLYVGLGPDTLKTAVDSFLFFLTYSFLRNARLRKSTGSRHLPPLEELGIGYFAGAFTKLLTIPIANVVTRFQSAERKGTVSNAEGDKEPTAARMAAKAIYREKGVKGFWSGYSASLILTLNPSLTFFLFELLKKTLLLKARQENLSPTTTFLFAAISKAVASSITYPFSLVKTRLQVSSRSASARRTKQGKSGDENSPGTTSTAAAAAADGTVFATIWQIARTEGFSALYEGLPAEATKGFLNHGLTMLIKDTIHLCIIKLYYTTLKLLRRFPDPEKLAEIARARAQQTATKVQDGIRSTGHGLAESASVVADKSKTGIDAVSDQASEVIEDIYNESSKAVSGASEILDFVMDYVGQIPEDRGLEVPLLGTNTDRRQGAEGDE